MSLALICENLAWLPHDSPEAPPGDDVPDHAGHVQYIRVLLINLKDNRAVLAETLQKKTLSSCKDITDGFP